MPRKRRFYELYMGPLLLEEWPDTLEKCRTYVEKCQLYNNHYCIATVVIRSWSPTFHKRIKELRKKCPIEAVRIHLDMNKTGALLSLLRTVRFAAEIVSAQGYDRKVLALASRDRRIDIVSIIPGVSPPLYRGDIAYLERTGKLVEIGIGGLDISNARILSKQLFHIKHVADRVKTRVPVIVTAAGAPHYTPRDPRSLIEFGAIFLGLDRDKAANALSSIIEEKLEVNKRKLSGKIPVEGVYIEEG